MKTILQKISVLLLCAILVCSVLPSRAVAGYQIPGVCQVQTEAGTAAVKRLLHLYLSVPAGYGHGTVRHGIVLLFGCGVKCRLPEPGRGLRAFGRGERPLGRGGASGCLPAEE